MKSIWKVLLLASASIGMSAHAAIVQVDTNFVAFSAEIGTLNDASNNNDRFDVLPPDIANDSVGNYLAAKSADGTVSFDVQFAEPTVYTIFARYRETSGTNPTLSITFGGTTQSATIFEDANEPFGWTHLSGVDITSLGLGSPETITLSYTGQDFFLDSLAIVKQSAITSDGFAVSDTTIPPSAYSIPEPSSTILLALGAILIGLRRRRD